MIIKGKPCSTCSLYIVMCIYNSQLFTVLVFPGQCTIHIGRVCLHTRNKAVVYSLSLSPRLLLVIISPAFLSFFQSKLWPLQNKIVKKESFLWHLILHFPLETISSLFFPNKAFFAFHQPNRKKRDKKNMFSWPFKINCDMWNDDLGFSQWSDGQQSCFVFGRFRRRGLCRIFGFQTGLVRKWGRLEIRPETESEYRSVLRRFQLIFFYCICI